MSAILNPLHQIAISHKARGRRNPRGGFRRPRAQWGVDHDIGPTFLFSRRASVGSVAKPFVQPGPCCCQSLTTPVATSQIWTLHALHRFTCGYSKNSLFRVDGTGDVSFAGGVIHRDRRSRIKYVNSLENIGLDGAHLSILSNRPTYTWKRLALRR